MQHDLDSSYRSFLILSKILIFTHFIMLNLSTYTILEFKNMITMSEMTQSRLKNLALKQLRDTF